MAAFLLSAGCCGATRCRFTIFLLKLFRSLPLALLLAAFICFAGAYLGNRYGQVPDVLLRTDAARLQKLVMEAESSAEQEATAIATQVQEGKLTFETLVEQTTYPCFIFRGNQLLYWSDHTVPPNRSNAQQDFHEKLVVMQFGRYLALRHVAGPYVVLTYIPLEESYGISNRYLREGAERALFRGLNLRLVADGGRSNLPKLYSNEGNYLFSLESLQPNPVTVKYVPLALMLLGLGLYMAAWLVWAQRLFRARRELAGAAAVVLPLGVLRAMLLHFGLPFSFIELPLFNPRVYAASWLSPSLGDLLINALLLTVAAGYGLLLQKKDSKAVARFSAATSTQQKCRQMAAFPIFAGISRPMTGAYPLRLNHNEYQRKSIASLPARNERAVA